MKFRKLSPLMVIVILGVCIGGISAAWYWFSPTITGPTITVTEWIEAKVVDPLNVWNGGDQKEYGGLTEVTALIDGSTLELDPDMYFAFIKVESTNAEDLYLSIDATYPAGMAVTANVRFKAIQVDNSWTSADMLLASDVATDGTQSVNLELLDNPLYALMTWPDSVLFVVAEFSIGQGSLTIGVHPFNVVFSLGDSITTP